MDPTLVDWLITGAAGPALVALPINWTAGQLTRAAQRWFGRLRNADGLSRLVQAAGASADLTADEFAAVRQLLKDPKTWKLIGNGSVEDLATEIDSCLRTSGGSRGVSITAARAIARGLLEFAVFDLEPELFQRVLMARLARLESGQAATVDRAMLSLHADLVAWVAQQSREDEQRFRRLMAQLGQILDRLPPAMAGREEIALYLAALIWWLSSDPWPRDLRLRGPVLAPAAIERELTVAGAGLVGEWDVDADELARHCTRLVVLGDPGSGKTWLARRTARRCANAALEALTTGASLDEVELPLFTTCSLLAAEGGNIRHAAVSSALDQLGDLGGSRIADALQVFFTERNAPTLLVIDSLDEARSPDARLRQVDTLPWRIMLTSRPRSWKQQLTIDQTDDTHRLGNLRPLRYPDDVESLIACWFTQQPSKGEELTAQIARRPDLQQAASVPLILAFCCIIGGDQPLPATRRELNALVLRRILTGLWRGGEVEGPDPEACSATLRDWAWAGATSDRISGIGTWADEIPVPHVRMNQADQAAVDHVAAPLGPENLDTGMTLRRFIHRSIREHLTAEHVAIRMTAAQAALELLNHLWYDPDWEYVAPAALTMHPQRDQVLQEVIHLAARSEQISQDLAPIDGCRELRRFLARVATESSESDWASESATIIGRARFDLATDGLFGDLRAAPGWESSDRPIWQMLSTRLAREYDGRQAQDLARALAELAPGPAEREQAGQALVARLARENDPWKARDMAWALAGLAPGPAVREQAGQALVTLLARENDPWKARDLARTLIRLDPNNRLQAGQALLALLARENDAQFAGILAWALARLGPDERKLARQGLIALLDRQDDPYEACDLVTTLAGLEPDPYERKVIGQALLALLARDSDPWKARKLARTLAGLEQDPDKREKAGQVLLALLVRQTDQWEPHDLWETLAGLRPKEQERARQALLALVTPFDDPREARYLARKLNRPHPGPPEWAQAQYALSTLLAGQSGTPVGGVLARMLAGLDEDQRAQARQLLLAMMAGQADPREAPDLARTRARLNPDPAECARLRQVLLARLARESNARFARVLAQTLGELDPGPAELAQARRVVLARLVGQDDPGEVRELAKALAGLDLDPDLAERARTGQVLLARLSRQDDPWKARELALALAALDPDQRAMAGQALLARLARERQVPFAKVLAQTLVDLGPGPVEQAQARQVLLARLARESNVHIASLLAETLERLEPDLGERKLAGQALLALLARQNDPYKARDLARVVAGLDLDPDERAPAGQALLALLARESDVQFASVLAEALAELGSGERRLAGQALVTVLARQPDAYEARDLTRVLARLDPDPAERAKAVQALIALLARQGDPWKARVLVRVLAGLKPGSAEQEQAVHALVTLLAREKYGQYTKVLAETLARLGSDERKLAKQALLAVLARESDPGLAETLVELLTRLSPDARILENWRSWAVPPGRNLVAAARRNSTLSSWLEVLPALRELPAHAKT